MEFTYTGTIYFDIDWMVVDFVENWGDNDLDDFLHDYVARLDACEYYNVDESMIEQVKEKMMEYEVVKQELRRKTKMKEFTIYEMIMHKVEAETEEEAMDMIDYSTVVDTWIDDIVED